LDLPFDEESFVKDLYRDVKDTLLLQESSDPSWVILDDVSALAALVGGRTIDLWLGLLAPGFEIHAHVWLRHSVFKRFGNFSGRVDGGAELRLVWSWWFGCE
jgi:hypothetical protein